MFDESIDVAKIMREIKSKVVPENRTEHTELSGDWSSDIIAYNSELDRIALFIDNSENEVASSSIGANLPQYNRFPWPVNKIFRGISKVMRKSIKFIIRDQEEINQRLNAVNKALRERQDIIIERQNLMISMIDNMYNQNIKNSNDSDYNT